MIEFFILLFLCLGFVVLFSWVGRMDGLEEKIIKDMETMTLPFEEVSEGKCYKFRLPNGYKVYYNFSNPRANRVTLYSGEPNKEKVSDFSYKFKVRVQELTFKYKDLYCLTRRQKLNQNYYLK